MSRRANLVLSSLARCAALAVCVLLAGCGSKDAAEVTVTAPPMLGLTHLVADLSIGSHTSTITAPMSDGATLTFPKTISLVYPSGLGATLQVSVRGYAGSAVAAEGIGSAPVVHRGVTMVTVDLQPVMAPTSDGGTAVDASTRLDGATADGAVVDMRAGGG